MGRFSMRKILPKKYQDIYPLDFESSNWQGLWDALKEVFSFWMDQGVQHFSRG